MLINVAFSFTVSSTAGITLFPPHQQLPKGCAVIARPRISVADFNKVKQLTEGQVTEELNLTLSPRLHDESEHTNNSSEPTIMFNLAWGVDDIVKHTCRTAAENFMYHTLEQLLEMCGGKFRPGTVASLAMQLIDRLQLIHTNGIVHRRIGPWNLSIGPERWGVDLVDESNTIFLIDRDTAQTTESLKDYEEELVDDNFLLFASMNAHLGKRSTAWDDLEAAGYMLFYFLRGELPWTFVQTLPSTAGCKSAFIHSMKQTINPAGMCRGGIPLGFASFLNYVRRREGEPDYDLMRDMFRDILMLVEEEEGPLFDWEMPLAALGLHKIDPFLV